MGCTDISMILHMTYIPPHQRIFIEANFLVKIFTVQFDKYGSLYTHCTLYTGTAPNMQYGILQGIYDPTPPPFPYGRHCIYMLSNRQYGMQYSLHNGNAR